MCAFKIWIGDNGSGFDNGRYDPIAHVLDVSRFASNVCVPIRHGDNDRFAPRLAIVSELVLELVAAASGNSEEDYLC